MASSSAKAPQTILLTEWQGDLYLETHPNVYIRVKDEEKAMELLKLWGYEAVNYSLFAYEKRRPHVQF